MTGRSYRMSRNPPLRPTAFCVFFVVSVILTIIYPSASKAQPWHDYLLDKLVDEHCQPKLMATMRFLGDDRAFWSSVSVAASNELEGIASMGGIDLICSSGSRSDILRCRAMYITAAQRARTCMSLARNQIRALILEERNN